MQGPTERSLRVTCRYCSGAVRLLAPSESRRTDDDPDHVVESECPHCEEQVSVSLRVD